MAKHAVDAKSSRRQRVMDAIQTEIFNGSLKPGDPLRQIALSQHYGVAQSVIRESLQTLEQHGVVSSTGQGGFYVRTLERADLVDAYRVREVLEGLAARLCCRKASLDDIDALRERAHQIHLLSATGTRSRRNELEYQFHQRFLAISGNETLQRVSVGYRFVGQMVVTDRDPDQLLQEHLAIVEAIAMNQPDKAEIYARRHVAKSAESIARLDPL